MSVKWFVSRTGFALCCLTVSAAYCGIGVTRSHAGPTATSQQKLAEVIPGRSTKAQITSLLGAPWRVEQFNDCGQAMDDQADETWEYRGKGPHGAYRIHIEFDDHGVAHLIATIPDKTPGGRATVAKVAPTKSAPGMAM